MEQWQRAGVTDFGLPDLEAGQYLVDAMFKLRPTRSGGMGMVPTDWPEILAFAAATQRIDEPWEFEALFAMCEAYCEELRAGESPHCIAPVDRTGDPVADRKKARAGGIKAAMRGG